MIKYHVYGKVVKEYYHMGMEVSVFPYNWDDREYSLNKNSTADKIFEDILKVQRVTRFNRYIDKGNEILFIPDPFMKRWFWRREQFVKYKEFKTIITDLELRDGETVRIGNKDYKVKYKYNDDKQQNELYIEKVIETIIDEEELEHAKQVCNGVVKRILRYNRKQQTKEQKEKQEEKEKAIKDKQMSKDIKQGKSKSLLEKIKLFFKGELYGNK
ncbi:hypothetical protein FKF97_10365 [Clostridium perfringens]|nr:hypothetical protein [Clostridium perfringens]